MPENTDDTSLEISVDNGSNYKNYTFNDNTVNAINVSAKLIKPLYDGTDFNGEVVAPLPYTITHTQSIDSTKDTVAPIKGIPEFTEGLGLSLNQVLLDGNFDVTTAWTDTNTTLSVSGNVGSFTATAQNGGISQSITTVIGNKYNIRAWVKATSADVKLQVNGEATSVVAHTGGGAYELLSVVFTATVAGTVTYEIIDTHASTWALVNVKIAMSIETSNTPISAFTAPQINGILNEYIEGITDNINLSIKSVGVQLFDKLEYTAVDYAYKIRVMPSSNVAWSVSTQYKLYDINENEISTSTALTVATTADTAYIAFVATIADEDTFMLNEGTTAEDWVKYNSQTLSFKQLDLTDLHLRSVGSIRDKVRKEQEDWVKDEFVGVALAVAIGATINTTTIPLINTSGIFEAYDTVNNEYQYGAYGDTLTLTGTATVYYDYLTPLLANEILEATGSLIQEEVTTIIQGANIGTSVSIKYALNEGQSLLTVIDNLKHLTDETDDLQARAVTNETAIALNTAKNNYPSADATKVGFMTITGAFNADKASVWTQLMSTTVNVPSGTVASNITLSETMENFDILAVFVSYPAGADYRVILVPVTTSIDTYIEVRRDLTKTYLFHFEKDSVTTMTAESGVYRLLTLGSTAGIEDTANSDIDVDEIWGIKYS
jgi:hypothetical protein